MNQQGEDVDVQDKNNRKNDAHIQEASQEDEDDGADEQLAMEEQSEDDELEIADERKDENAEKEEEELDEVESIGG